MTTTTHIGLTLVEQAQASKEVTVNTALVRIDAILNTGAIDKDLATPPSSPAAGDVYIVAGSPTGAWSGHAKDIAYYDQIWRFITPREGMSLWVNDEDKLYTYNGSSWAALALGESNTASNLGAGEGVFSAKTGVDLRFKSLVAGSNISLSATSDEITIDATGGGGGGGGYDTVQEEGSDLTQRAKLNFVGSAITASDDAGSTRTKVETHAQVNALADLASNGLVARTGSGALAARTLTAGSGKVSVSNGNGVSGNPTVDVSEAGLTLGNISGTVGTTQIAGDAVTYAKMQNVSATDKILGRATAGAGDVEEITCTSAARSLLDDTSASAMRTTLGVAIGSDVQAYDATLASLAAYNTNGLLAQTAADTFAGRTLTAGSGISVTNGDGVSGNPSVAADINGLTADGLPDGAADYVMTYDASATGLKKVLLNNLPTAGGAPASATYVTLTTNGSLSAERTLAVGTGLSLTDGGANGNATVALAGGKQTVWVPAAAMRPSASGGCAALALVATSANRPDLSTLDFDASTEEYAQFWIAMPKSWNESTVTAQFLWSHPSTATNFGVVWGLQGVAISDDDSIDAAFGTAQTVTDTGGTISDLYITAETSTITIGGSPAEGDMAAFRVYRKASDASDTLAVDARLHGVRLFFTTNAGTDD